VRSKAVEYELMESLRPTVFLELVIFAEPYLRRSWDLDRVQVRVEDAVMEICFEVDGSVGGRH